MTRGLARRMTEAFMSARLDLSQRPGAPSPGWQGVPEVVAAGRLRDAGASEADVRLFLTFTAAMDRARDADRLWYASERLFLEHRWTFQPEEIIGRSLSELAGALRSAGVSQRHSVDTAAWRTIAESLIALTQHPVRMAIYEGRGDARVLLKVLQDTDARGAPCFPLLRGPKIGLMWVRMLAYPGGAAITSIESLPVAVDVQVRKVTEYLGVAGTRGQDLEKIRRPIQEIWAEDVRQHGTEGPPPLANTAAALDPALWFFGKWGCTRCEQAGRRLPISEVCSECQFDLLVEGLRPMTPHGR